VRASIFELLAPGAIGRFWPLVDGVPEPPEMQGALRRDDEGYWVIDVEAHRTTEGDDRPAPTAVVGILGDETVLLTDLRRTEDRRPGMGQRIHVIRLWFSTLVTGPDDVLKVDAAGIVMAEIVFPDHMVWASYTRPDWRYRRPDDPLSEGHSLDFPKYNATRHAIGNGMSLGVTATWRGTHNREQLHIPSGLSLKLTAKEPVATKQYIETFSNLRDLISLCWVGRVMPVPGAGRVNNAQTEEGRFWSQQLLEEHPAPPAVINDFPAVRLKDLGGPQAFVRWLIICRHFPRATRGVSEGLYVGASVETRVLNIVSAIEYWVKRHRGTAAWARADRSGAQNATHRLIKHLHPTFKSWVGDGQQFSKKLTSDYNSIKHSDAFTTDYDLLHTYTVVARLILIADLLNEVAGSTLPGELIAKHFWWIAKEVKTSLPDRKRRRSPRT